MLKARSLAIALLGLACVASSAAPVQQQAAASSQMGRMLTEDLPLPSDWSRQLQDETSLSGSTSYSFAFTDDRPEAGATADTPDTTSAGGADPGAAGPSNPGAGGITSPDAPDSTGAEDPNPATTGPLLTPAPTPAPTIAATPAPTPKGTIQAVEITMSIGGSQTLRAKTVQALIAFLKRRLNLHANIAILSNLAAGTPQDAARALSPAMKHLISRHLQSEICAGPTANATVTLEGFADTAAVEKALAEIRSGKADVPVDETTSASDTICAANARLMMVPPSTDVLDDGAKPGAGEGDKKPSKLASIVIGVVVAAVGVMLILAVTIMVLKRRRNLAVSPN